MLCTCVVYMCCVHVLCTCVVYMCCVHVLGTCVVYMCCVHVLCTCVGYMCCVGTEAVCVGVGLPRQSAWYTQQGVESAEESSLPQCCLILHLVLCTCSGRSTSMLPHPSLGPVHLFW